MGTHIVEALLKTGKHVVKVISRPNSMSNLPSGVQAERVEYGDNDDTEIVRALQGQQALIIAMSVMAPRDTIIKLIRAAAKAGVSYILPNWYGHDPANEKLCKDTFLADAKSRIWRKISYFPLRNGSIFHQTLFGSELDHEHYTRPSRTLG